MPTPYYDDGAVTLYLGDALEVLRDLPAASVDSCVTSPPYFGLRDYGEAGQYGLEATPAEYVETMRGLFAEVRRVLADDGTLWLNLGDSYSGIRGNKEAAPDTKHAHTEADTPTTFEGKGAARKNLLMIPESVALALRADGWTLRNKIIWEKPNAMPESVTDRLACRYEQVFLFVKSQRYWFDLDPIREPLIHPEAADGSRVFGGINKAAALTTGSAARRTGNRYGSLRPWVNPEQSAERSADPRGRNPGDVWTISTKPFAEAHFAVMPPELAERCILAGSKPDGTVLDPFSGSGTTGMVAQNHGRKYVGIDLNKDYLDLSLRTRLAQVVLEFGEEGGR